MLGFIKNKIIAVHHTVKKYTVLFSKLCPDGIQSIKLFYLKLEFGEILIKTGEHFEAVFLGAGGISEKIAQYSSEKPSCRTCVMSPTGSSGMVGIGVNVTCNGIGLATVI